MVAADATQGGITVIILIIGNEYRYGYRWCSRAGDDYLTLNDGQVASGPPPRARGRPGRAARRIAAHGTTPASAGTTTTRPAPRSGARDHPRERGDDERAVTHTADVLGPPPRARGRPGHRDLGHRGSGTTPERRWLSAVLCRGRPRRLRWGCVPRRRRAPMQLWRSSKSGCRPSVSPSSALPSVTYSRRGQAFWGKPRLMPPWEGSSQRVVTTLPRVKKWKPSVPWAWVSPNSEFFQPPKE